MYDTVSDFEPDDAADAIATESDFAAGGLPAAAADAAYDPIDLAALADVPAAFQAYVRQQCMSCT